MRLKRRYLEEMIAHAREEKPREACGLIAAGGEGDPVQLYRTTNADPRPEVRYNIEPLDLLRVFREMEEKGWSLCAIYHSHPRSEAYPSATDVSLSHYSEAVYLIVSLAVDEAPVVRAFRIVEKKIVEEALEVVDDGILPAPAPAGGTPAQK